MGSLATSVGGADAGAIYSGRDWTYRGQLIEANLFENISSYLCQPGGAKNCFGQAPRALHSDDGMSGWTVVYNHFRNVTQVQNAYSSRDITFMHNTIEHVLSHEALNGKLFHSLSRSSTIVQHQ